MTGKLRYSLFSLHIILIMLSISTVCVVNAQVSISQLGLQEIAFTVSESSERGNLRLIGISDNELLRSAGMNIDGGISPFSEQNEDNSAFFIQTRHGTALGHFEPTDGNAPFTNISLENKSDRNVGEFHVAFDFIERHDSTLNAPAELYFSYRINDSEWISPKGSVFKSGASSENENEWQSYSIQMRLTDLFLRPDDVIQFQWLSNKGESYNTFPIALQRLEFEPVAAKDNRIESGRLIITELMPDNKQNNDGIEYIELYNASSKPLSLKGVVFKSEDENFSIQTDVYAEPYSFFILANKNYEILTSNAPDYYLNRPLLSEQGGYIELLSDNKIISKANYEQPDPGVAWELTNAADSYDSYTGIQQLQPATQVFYQNLKGSPGRSGNTKKVFGKELSPKSWYLFSYPGQPVSRLNRGVDMKSISISESENEPSGETPNLFYNDSDNPLMIYSEKDENATDKIDLQPIKNMLIGGNPNYKPLKLNELLTNNRQPVPAVYAWNNSAQHFSLLTETSSAIPTWGTFVVHPEIDDQLFIDYENSDQNIIFEKRFLDIQVFDENSKLNTQNEQYLRVEFSKNDENSSRDGYHLPVIWPLSIFSDSDKTVSLAYFRHSSSEFQANSFIQLPIEPQNNLQIDLGYESTLKNQEVTLKWTLSEHLPEEWKITLTDQSISRTIDMRDESSYSFRDRGIRLENPEYNDPGLYLFNPSQDSRFIINIILFEQEEDVSETELPEEVNLKPNYPNPFNPTTNISFFMPEQNQVRLGIYNVVGQQVALLIDDNLSAGDHTVSWNASDMPSGIYIVQLEAGRKVLTRKMTLIK